MFNGFVIKVYDVTLCVDPGVDFLSRCSQSEIDLSRCNNIFLSHAHFDHYSSLNVIIEQIGLRGNLKSIVLIIPQEALDHNVISRYHLQEMIKAGGKVIVTAANNQNIGLSKTVDLEPFSVYHGQSECFGFTLKAGDIKIGYTADAGYTKLIKTSKKTLDVSEIAEPIYEQVEIVDFRRDLKSALQNVDVLIANFNSFEFNQHSHTHLTAQDIVHLVAGSRIRTILLLHLPVANQAQIDLAIYIKEFIERQTNLKVILPLNSGLSLDLNR